MCIRDRRRRIGGGGQALFEGLQLLHIAAAPQGIDQGVFSRPRLGELSAGHRRWGSIPSVMALAQCPCHPSPQRRHAQKKLRLFTRARSILFIIFHDLAWFRQRRSAHLIDRIGAAYRLFEKRVQPGSLRSFDESIDTGHAPIRARCRSQCPLSLIHISEPTRPY